MDTDSFIVHVKTNDIYKDIPKDLETRFKLWIDQTTTKREEKMLSV